MLYPYRPSSVKNRQRWNFGVLYPVDSTDAQDEAAPSTMQTECLILADSDPLVEVRVRFLHLKTRTEPPNVQGPPPDWQEAEEREVALPELRLETLCRHRMRHPFSFEPQVRPETRGIEADAVIAAHRQETVVGEIEVSAGRAGENVFQLKVLVRNTTPPANPRAPRDEVLLHCLVSTHTILGVKNGEFVSLLEPQFELQELAAHCQNIGGWPVLVGEPGAHDTMLASPIILYDYPQIAPESAGDLFDGTEIDEILSLRIMTLTEDEKREICASDERARQILERTDNMPAEQFMKLHGAVRGLHPLQEKNP